MTRAPMKITLEIDPFCNCEGCIEKVKSALGKLDVKFSAMNPDIGKFTILTTEHPDVIKYALNDTFPKKKEITLSQETNNPYPLHAPHVDADAIAIAIANALVIMSQAKRLESVEYTKSNTFKLNFTRPALSSIPPTVVNLGAPNGDHPEDAPPLPPPPQTNIRPSAPPIPTTPNLVYGYPPKELYVMKDANILRDCDSQSMYPLAIDVAGTEFMYI
ncbi:hypothetical protein E3N88_45471 [Mikania micrantha]|uniref:HMA domain-containing protein n=1 Tax=Mikania micrantha TaxID=192012 RepID=A0A5N6L974_9ASTR|nr:hypothetical protein E3N88_45471 [Mikania micrantha]